MFSGAQKSSSRIRVQEPLKKVGGKRPAFARVFLHLVHRKDCTNQVVVTVLFNGAFHYRFDYRGILIIVLWIMLIAFGLH
ncbi:hypothetical protein DsansV1_C03g0027411 [Dioscorea sansibarensis]